MQSPARVHMESLFRQCFGQICDCASCHCSLHGQSGELYLTPAALPPLPCRCIRQCSISVNLENMLANSPAALSVRIREAEAINCWSIPYRYIFQGLWSFPSVLVMLVSLSLSGCASVTLTPLLFIKAHNQLGNEGKKLDEPVIGENIPGYY